MKKSDMTVTMPLTAWNEYELLKVKFENLVKEISACFDISEVKNGGVTYFDAQRALEVCKTFAPYSSEGSGYMVRV